MKKGKGSLLVPVGSFAVALGLSLLINGGMMRLVSARQAGGGTPCTGALTVNSITVAVGNAVKGNAGWTHEITNQPVTGTNSKQASLNMIDQVALTANTVVVHDNLGKKHTWATYPFVAFYAPVFKPTFPAGGGNINLATASVTHQGLVKNLEDDINTAWAQAKLGITVKTIACKFAAQPTTTTEFGIFTCVDGTVLGFNPRPPTVVNVTLAGNGGPVVN